jgi:uncharacterized membrane protein YfcA
MIAAAAIGVLAGIVAGMLGVGGGILFIPGLVFFLGLTQVDAEATSLLAIVPVALLGAYRQHAYGNVRIRDGLLVGALAIPAAAIGVALVNALPERAIEVGFACLQLVIAARLGRRALRPPERPAPASPPPAR